MSLETKPGGFLVRLRYGRDASGKELRTRFLIATKDETVAADRRARMQSSADALSKLQHPQAGEFLVEMGRVAADEKAFTALERVVGKLVSEAGSVPPAGPASGPSTFRDVVLLWTSGKLTVDHEDFVAPKDEQSRREDLAILSVFFPAFAGKPLQTLTDADITAARRLIPNGRHHNTRRKYLIKLRLVLRLAKKLKFTETIPEVEIPRRRASNLFGYLYPHEEAALIAHRETPLRYRVLYGYLARNGCRIGETLELTWDHIDLETGDIHIDKRWTKTSRARRWVLDADVLEAFEAYHRISGSPKGGALVFPGRGKAKLTHGAIRKRFLRDLRNAGVARKSILEGADGINALRVHDLRASFVTLALRAGRDLKWIMTRTGHEDLAVLRGYDRLVQDANEHHLPKWFVPMAQAIPELRPKRQAGPSPGQTHDSAAFMGQFLRPQGTGDPGETEGKHREKAPSVTAETSPPPTSGPAEFQGVGQAGPGSAEVLPEPTDSPVEQVLAAALQAAIGAQRWDLAQSIVAELGERRRARVAPAVTSLSDARRKRDGEGK